MMAWLIQACKLLQSGQWDAPPDADKLPSAAEAETAAAKMQHLMQLKQGGNE